MDRVVVVFRMVKRKKTVDIDIPLDISANDLVLALNSAYELGINLNDLKNCYLQAENPIALLRGNRSLREFGLRNGTKICFTE